MSQIKYADHESEFHSGSVEAQVTNDQHRGLKETLGERSKSRGLKREDGGRKRGELEDDTETTMKTERGQFCRYCSDDQAQIKDLRPAPEAADEEPSGPRPCVLRRVPPALDSGTVNPQCDHRLADLGLVTAAVSSAA
ncbi:hypothetical protein C0J45_11635 [Silurus meridionalis]|nr:hypothetical protein C0J45_11635 [Silurus meridionalis]